LRRDVIFQSQRKRRDAIGHEAELRRKELAATAIQSKQRGRLARKLTADLKRNVIFHKQKERKQEIAEQVEFQRRSSPISPRSPKQTDATDEEQSRLRAEIESLRAADHELRARLQQSDEELQKLKQRSSEMEHELQTARAEQTQSRAIKSSGGLNGDELPDFIRNLGSDEVMSYVQGILAENAQLKSQSLQASTSPLSPIQGRMDGSFEASPSPMDLMVAGSPVNVADLRESDGPQQIPPLIELLQAQLEDARICAQVCQAIENLTFTDMGNRQLIVQRGGIEQIMRAMELHRDSALVQRSAMDALWNLSFDDEAVDRVASGSGIERITIAMEQHASIAELQGAACAVFLNLSVRADKRTRLSQAGALDLIFKAMERHASNEEVLEQGCQALYMLAYDQEFRPLVLAAKGRDAAVLAASHNNGAGRARKWGRWLQEVLAF
jgi:hypothetical protein